MSMIGAGLRAGDNGCATKLAGRAVAATRSAIGAGHWRLAGWAPLLTASLSSALAAQTVPPPAPPAAAVAPRPAERDDPDEIVVTGERQRGAVVGDIKPDEQLGPAEIRSYGVSSMAELLDELAPQTTSGRGRGGEAPVTLLNGHRISGFAEIRDIPVEAIARIDILPEEVSLKYGYRADQRVVNIVLRQRFRAETLEAGAKGATDGGNAHPTANATYLRIDKTGRLNVSLDYGHADGLLDSDRSILEAPPRVPFDLTGNVRAPGGGEIDPGLSALAGRPVTVAGVPASALAGPPSLAAFLPSANLPNITDIAGTRSLLPQTSQASANAVYNRVIGRVGVTVNARGQFNDSRSQLGLAGAALLVPAGNPFSPFGEPVEVDRYLGNLGPLGQHVRTANLHLGTTVDGDIGHWRWSVTGNADRVETRTETQRGADISAAQAAITAGDPGANPFGPLAGAALRTPDRARSVASSGGADLLLSGALFDLPAGQVSTSFRTGVSISSFTAASDRAGVMQAGSVTRNIVNGQINIDVPLTSRSKDVLAAIGDLSVNGNIALDHLSDFGTRTTLGAGLHWTPLVPLSLVVSATDEHGAPTSQQLGNPLVVTPQVQFFDPRTGGNVEVSQTGGGNPALTADHRRVYKIGVTLKPLSSTDLTITANYVDSRIRNAIAAFPLSSASIAFEDAFPDRYTRSADGTLLSVDTRPVNLADESQRQLRWGINFSKPLKSAAADRFAALRAGGGGDGRRPPDGAGAPGSAAPAADPRGRGAGGGGRGFGGGRGGFGGGRLQLAVYHTWTIADTVQIRPGLPTLDLLNGGSVGGSGGAPRHKVEVQAGFSRDGLGARLSGNWQSATSVTGADAASTLRFSDLATLNFRLFVDFGQRPGLAQAHPWLRGARLTLAFDNLFNQRQRVTDGSGATPISYQPDRLDPEGRSVRLVFRKLFFTRPPGGFGPPR